VAKAGDAMTAASTSPTGQSLAAVAAFFGLVLATLLVGAAFLLANHNMQDEFETKTRMLESLQRQALPSAGANEAPVQAAARVAAISAPSETIAASELQKDILACLKDAGGAVHSIHAEATSDTIGDGLKRLNAQITFDGSINALQKVLFTLESGTPYIVVDSLVVQPTSTSAPGTKAGETLRVTLVASSYWK